MAIGMFRAKFDLHTEVGIIHSYGGSRGSLASLATSRNGLKTTKIHTGSQFG
jgi:hypothetical protein